MPNPVQVVLNHGDFIGLRDPRRQGPRTEFFPKNDGSFTRHKRTIASRLERIEAELARVGLKATVLKVSLRDDAYAKSHRPNRAIFTPDVAPCVGAGNLGEMFYFVSAPGISSIRNAVESAEESTTIKVDKNGKNYFYPTPNRSDLGAVKDVEITSAESKRQFSADAAAQWLSSASTIGGYIVELFQPPRVRRSGSTLVRTGYPDALKEVIGLLGENVRAKPLREVGSVPAIEVVPVQKAALAGPESKMSPDGNVLIDTSIAANERLLRILEEHPLVRRILLPYQLSLESAGGTPAAGSANLAPRVSGTSYPRVGVIDNGISNAIGDWVIHRHDFLDDAAVGKDHGTFIAGLLTWGQGLNGSSHCFEADGCELVDVALYPSAPFNTVYANGFDDFLSEVEGAVSEARRDHDVRVFNLSINLRQPVQATEYSYFASRLDEMADRYDVIIVNSAGNLPSSELRKPWPKRPTDVLSYFAARTSPDTICQPSESARSITVGALNPQKCAGHDEGAPTTYTRRGPGLRMGQKPDVAHFGGSQGFGVPPSHGLRSLDVSGGFIENAGTSFAAPLVAKTLASLDARTNGALSTHTLKALLIHNAAYSPALSSPRLKDLARQFSGFGTPASSLTALETDDHSITLLFDSVIPERRKSLQFNFAWPSVLVDAIGACHGSVRMTLVYDAPLDRHFGAEAVRVNMDAHLRQRVDGTDLKGKPRYKTQLDQCFLPKTANQPALERELIHNGLKWWPTKRYIKKIGESGVGNYSDWRLEVDCTVRAEAEFPSAGVPFTVILTIEDPQKKRPVFQELRRSLLASKVQLQDIQVQPRTQQRVR